MAKSTQTQIYEEITEEFNGETGEITHSTKTRTTRHDIGETDEFFKASRYLSLIFAWNHIPERLLGISLIFAQRMEFRTNFLYLLKADKDEIATQMALKPKTVEALITECLKYDIIRRVSQGKYVVNGFLFSTGDTKDTRAVQAAFDLDKGIYKVRGKMHNTITGETVLKSVTNKQPTSTSKDEIPGQMSLDDFDD